MDRFTGVALILTPVFVIFARSLINKRRDNPSGLPLPPGPPRLPIAGNFFGIKDLGAQWLTYTEWSKEYGELLYVEIFGQRTLVLNSEKVVEDLLEKRSHIYSDRPQLPMVKLIGFGFNVGFLPYGPELRKAKKLMHPVLTQHAILDYRDIEMNKVHQFLRNLLHVPAEMEEHIKTFNASTITSILYGYEMAPRNDPFASLATRATAVFANSFFPGAAMVNAFPVLQYLPEWFPGAGFKKYARECSKLTRQFRDIPYDFVVKQMADGTAPNSMVSAMIEGKEDEEAIKGVAGTIYAAAIETVASVLSAFIMAMIMFPAVQQKAQAEIDRVTGGNRLPDFSDREALLYIEAICRETLRWSEVAPLGAPHMTTEPDVYGGYFIPKGTVVYANVWAMSRNEEKYPDPLKFIPERYIDAEGHLTDDLAEYQFGYGRRVCAGKDLAESCIWIAIVSTLAAFDIKKAKDENGREIDVVPEYTTGIITYPKPYPFSITPRSTRTAELVQQTG